MLQVLANFGLLVALLCGHVVQRIFFGSLRANEVEASDSRQFGIVSVLNFFLQRLYDRLWFFITESLLAFTIFRDEFDTPFALMFGFLLFVKSFHWLASDRIEWVSLSQPRFEVDLTVSLCRWTKDLTLDRPYCFTSEWPSFLLSCGRQTASCSCSLLSTRCQPG